LSIFFILINLSSNSLPSLRGTSGHKFRRFPESLALLRSNGRRAFAYLHSADAALDAAGLGEAVVVVHQEVALNLL